MRNQFTSRIVLLLVLNVLIKPLYIIGIDAQVQNEVGHEAYGLYFALFNFCFLFQVILDMGILNYNSKEVAQDRTAVESHFSQAFSTKLILILLFFGAVCIGGIVLRYPSHYFGILISVALVMTLQTLYVYLRSHFSALGYYNTDSLLSVLDKVLLILVAGYIIYVSKDITIGRFISAQLITLVVSVLFVLVLLGNKFRLKLSFSLRSSLTLIRKSLPYALVTVFTILYTRMDGVMLERLIDDEAYSAGIYANAFRLLDAANILGYLFSMLLLPMFANKISKQQDVNELVKTAFGLLLVLTTIISAISWFYSEEIMSSIYKVSNSDNIAVFRILMISFWFMSTGYIFGALILAKGETRTLNYLLIAGIVINLSMNLYLIPRETAIGAAKATLITHSFIFLGLFILSKVKFKLKYSASYIYKAVIFVFLCCGLFYFFSQKLSILWIIEVLIGGFILIGFSILFGLFRFNFANKTID